MESLEKLHNETILSLPTVIWCIVIVEILITAALNTQITFGVHKDSRYIPLNFRETCVKLGKKRASGLFPFDRVA